MSVLEMRPGHRHPQGAERRSGSAPRPGRRRRLVVILLILATTLAGAAAATVLVLGQRLDDHVRRIPGVFAGLPTRPSPVVTGPGAGAMNILLLGTDRRSEVPTTGSGARAPAWTPGEQRSDTMMLLHIDADRRGAAVISLPRDSWVRIPGHGEAKINAAYSWGGPRLAVATVEALTGVRIDHLAVVDWSGYAAMIDLLGGIDVRIPRTVHDGYRDITWAAGRQHLNGHEALLYAGQRAGLPEGDLDRVRRQQAVLRSLSGAALDAASSPFTTYALVDSLTRHLSVDAGWRARDLAALAVSLRHLRPGDVDYLTVPVVGTGRVGAQSVVFLDRSSGHTLWRAVRSGDLDRWVRTHRDALTGTTVR